MGEEEDEREGQILDRSISEGIVYESMYALPAWRLVYTQIDHAVRSFDRPALTIMLHEVIKGYLLVMPCNLYLSAKSRPYPDRSASDGLSAIRASKKPPHLPILWRVKCARLSVSSHCAPAESLVAAHLRNLSRLSFKPPFNARRV